MSQQPTPALAESPDDHQVALSPFGHSDRDFAFDPLSTNYLPVLATVVFAGPSPDTIHVMVPDCLIPPVGFEVRIDLRHLITLQLGPATDISEDSSQLGLAQELCANPLTHTLLLQQKDYWEESNPSWPSGTTQNIQSAAGRSE